MNDLNFTIYKEIIPHVLGWSLSVTLRLHIHVLLMKLHSLMFASLVCVSSSWAFVIAVCCWPWAVRMGCFLVFLKIS